MSPLQNYSMSCQRASDGRTYSPLSSAPPPLPPPGALTTQATIGLISHSKPLSDNFWKDNDNFEKDNRMFAFLILWLTYSSCFIAFIRFSYNTLRLKHVRIEMTSLTRAKKLCSRDQWWLLGIHVYIREMYASSRLLTHQASVILWTASFSHVKARGHTLTRWQVIRLLRQFESLSLPIWKTYTGLSFKSIINLGISWKDLVSTKHSPPYRLRYNLTDRKTLQSYKLNYFIKQLVIFLIRSNS